MKYYCDKQRHLVCIPYTKDMLHLMAEDLNINRCWFHKNHYDIPKKRIKEISEKCIIITTKEIVKIIKMSKKINLSFELLDVEQKRLEEWKEKIKDLYGEYGRYKYTFSPSGIGNGIEVYSELAKLSINITDVDSW